MDVVRNEKHPQKYCFKILCKLIYYMGLGDLWYEKTTTPPTRRYIYYIWSFISNFYVFSVLINQFLAHARNNLTEKEKTDLFQFNFAHSSISAKIITVFFYKEDIRALMEHLLEGTSSQFYSLQLEKKSVRQLIKYCLVMGCSCYVTLSATTIEAITAYHTTGTPIRTEVVYYPSPSHSGVLANVSRFFVEFHWYWIVTIMVSIDCLTLSSLVVAGHKFRILQKYFGELSVRIKEHFKGKSKKEKEEQFKKEFIIGMNMHDDALLCAREVQYSLGYIYSIQLFESVFLIVMCLLKFVVAERTLIYLLANLLYISTMVAITGCYMMAAGDVTYEAELVPTALFHCGWERYARSREVRVLTVVALQRAQVPVLMTAFGVFIMSYSNFISVLRSSYSFFAVVY